jgi:hypothetical protein
MFEVEMIWKVYGYGYAVLTRDTDITRQSQERTVEGHSARSRM